MVFIHAGLKLNPDSMLKVLTEAGIKDWNDIVRGLKLEAGWIEKLATSFVNLFTRRNPTAVTKELLQKWPEPQSWEELARVIENIANKKIERFEIAQKTRELSESGRWLIE